MAPWFRGCAVSDENDERVGIRIFAIFLDGGKLFVVRATAKKILHAPNEKHLERSHQGRGSRAVKNFGKIVFPKIEFEQTEIPQIGGNQMLEDGIAKAFAEERFVAHEHIGWTQLARLEFADKPLRLRKSPHQKSSVAEKTFATNSSI
jgi:hypothetical protein